MKKTVFIFVMLFSTLGLFSQEEDQSIFQPMVILGFNATQVPGDNLAGFRKLGANGGAGMLIKLPKNFSVGFEILYSQKGSTTSRNESFRTSTGQNFEAYKLILDYVDIPVMVNYTDKDVAMFGVGLVYNNLVRYKELIGGVQQEGNPYKKAGLEIMGNVTFIFKEKIGVNMRYTYSLIDIRKVPTEYANNLNGKQKNSVLSLRGIYFF